MLELVEWSRREAAARGEGSAITMAEFGFIVLVKWASGDTRRLSLPTSTALNEIAALTIIHSDAALSGFGASQINALAMLFLELSSNVRSVNAIFFGLWLLPFGVLVIKSGFIPRFLGLLLIIAGFSYRVGSLLQCKPRRFNSAAGAPPDRAL